MKNASLFVALFILFVNGVIFGCNVSPDIPPQSWKLIPSGIISLGAALFIGLNYKR